MITFISQSAECCSIAQKMQREGADVQVYLHHPQYVKSFDGLLPKLKLSELPAAVRKSQTVIFDHVRPNMGLKRDKALLRAFGCDPQAPSVFGPVAEKLRKRKVHTIGSSKWTEQLELDRQFGSQVAQKIGLSIPVTYDFDSLSEARRFLEKKNTLWVLKPHNNLDLDLTYVEKYPGELEYMLREIIPRRIGSDKCPVMLQKKVEGTDLSTEGWFDGEQFTQFNHTYEDKTLMDGCLGPHIGSQSNTVWTKQQVSQIVNAINKLAPLLKEAGYIGPIDVNTVIAEKNGRPYFLEFTPRFGYDALYCLLSLLPGKVTDFFVDNFEQQPDSRLFACSQRVSIPPFPYEDEKGELLERARGVQIKAPPFLIPRMWWQDVLWDNGILQCAGADGIIGVSVGTGYSIGEAVNRCMETVQEVKIGSHKQYRTDHKERARAAYDALPLG